MNILKKTNKITLLIVFSIILIAVSLFIVLVLHKHNFTEEIPVGKTSKGYTFSRTCKDCNKTKYRHYKSMLTFIDDDAKTEAMLHWEKIIDATGIKMTSAIIPGKIKDTTDYSFWASYAGWDLLDRLKEKGIDYVHHTYRHERLSNFTEEEMHEDFKKSKEILTAHNINSEILVYPFYNFNETVKSVASDYFDIAFAGQNKIITDKNYEKMALNRMNINDPKLVKTITFEDGRTVECQGVKSYKKLKKEMKKAIKKEGWLVYVTHAYDSPAGKYYFDEESEQSIIDFCKYVNRLRRVKIVTATEGYKASQPVE